MAFVNIRSDPHVFFGRGEVLFQILHTTGGAAIKKPSRRPICGDQLHSKESVGYPLLAFREGRARQSQLKMAPSEGPG